jgi:hypothetical protein
MIKFAFTVLAIVLGIEISKFIDGKGTRWIRKIVAETKRYIRTWKRKRAQS